MNLAIFKTSYLGDSVVFLPVVQTLRRRFPEWRITLLTDERVAPLYSADIAKADLLTAAPDVLGRAWRQPLEFARWWATLRDRKIDASLVSYDQSSTVHALAWLAGGYPRAGGAGLRTRLQRTLTHGVAWRNGWSIAQWNWEIARALLTALGETEWPPEPPAPDLSHLVTGVARVPGRIVIHAGSKWTHTRWPLARFAEVAGRLARDHDVCWINTPETRDAILSPNVKTFESADLGTLAQLLASAALFLGNNSGPMHLANALGVPLVVVSGPSNYTWDPVWHRHLVKVLRHPALACLPCEHIHQTFARCTNDAAPMACMEYWIPDAVEAACRTALDRTVRA
jgi:ADP-heptose:LPS heptosyltransferase